MAAGLATAGTNAARPRAGDIARKDVPTARIDEQLSVVRERVRAAGADAAVVVNDQRVVFGLLRAPELEKDPGLRIDQAMRPGPSTFRPSVAIKEMVEHMSAHNLVNSPITTSDGRLIGLLYREDAVQVAGEKG